VAAILREALKGRRLRVLVIARPGAANVPFAQLRNDLQRALV
jgi:RNase P protein component